MLEKQSAYDRLTTGKVYWYKSIMSIEPRNEPRMLRWFRRTYPSYNLQPLLLKRYRELKEARAFNNWLGKRRQAQEGQRHLDDVSRLTEAGQVPPAALRARQAPGRGTGGGRSCATVQEDTLGARLQPAPALCVRWWATLSGMSRWFWISQTARRA